MKMARKVLDVQPIITARFVGGTCVTSEEAARASVADAIDMLGKDFECTVTFETDARCEFCGAAWNPGDEEYNGGCCSEDVEFILQSRVIHADAE